MSMAAMVGCSKGESPTSNEVKHEQSTKPEEAIKEVAKEEDKIKLEAWESSEINEATAEEFFFKYAQRLHTFKPELVDDYLTFLKPLMTNDRYPLFEKALKNEKMNFEYTNAKIESMKKIQWDGIHGYQIIYNVTFKENGVEKTEKALAALEVHDNKFLFNDFWQKNINQ